MVTLPPYTPMQKKIRPAFPNQWIDPNLKRLWTIPEKPDVISGPYKQKDPRLTKQTCPTCGQEIPNTTDKLRKTTI